MFFVSFTLVEDDLSQWRAYAENGAGICLGFDRSDFHEWDPRGYTCRVCTICYDEAMQIEFAHKIMNYLLSHTGGKANTADVEAMIFLGAFTDELTKIAARFKHPKFHQEKEVRVVAYLPEDLWHEEVCYRVDRNRVKTYLRIPGPDQEGKWPVTSLMVGPAFDGHGSLTALQKLTDRHQLNLSIEQSGAPYLP